MENFTHRPSSSRLNLALASTFLASIFFLTLRFSPSFLTLLLLIPSTLFLTKKSKSDSNSNRSSGHNPPLIGVLRPSEELSSNGDESSSSNGGRLGSGDFDSNRSSALNPPLIGVLRPSEELSSDGDESSSNGGGFGSGDFDSDLWMCLDELARNLPCAEDLSSEDDDSLIEIALLPNSNAIRTDSMNGLGGVRNLETCLPDLLPDSVVRQRGFVELLEEIDEEENLIEIDISRGLNRDFSLFAVEGSDSCAKSEKFNRRCPLQQSVI